MPTLSPDDSSRLPYVRRDVAESFGAGAELYDRARPRYPDELVRAIAASAPGRDFLDVGCGTGIAARQFRAAGCQVLGVEVDERMAAFARATGVDVEVSKFEDWDAAGRSFDAMVAGMTWHWIEPKAGAEKAAAVLRPGGRFAVFWYVLQPPPKLAAAFTRVYNEVLPDAPIPVQRITALLPVYERLLDRTAESLAATGAFATPERHQFPWVRDYTRDEWLDGVRTAGGTEKLAEAGKLEPLIERLGAVIDEAGGGLTVDSVAVALTATRN